MAHATRKATKAKRVAATTVSPSRVSPDYIAGMRAALTAFRQQLVLNAQFEEIREVACQLRVPFLWLMLVLEGKAGAVVDLDDVDALNAWMARNGVSRKQALGAEA